MDYLMIQNPGEAPIESYTLLGMSTSRGNSDLIGQFGSGAKFAINVLLRAGLKFHIYCGRTRLQFFTQAETIDGTTVERVYCRTSGGSNRTIDCGWCLDFGCIDWTDIGMALREFISNAIDRTVRDVGTFQSKNLVVGPCPNHRAKAGFTRIYVEYDISVQQYYRQLPKRFLHFSNTPELVNQHILPKLEPGNAQIYRQGVWVREYPKSSIFDYNIPLDIDESRNSNDYYVKAMCGRTLTTVADEPILKEVFRSLLAGEDTFESDFTSWELDGDSDPEKWTSAWQAVAGDSLIGSHDQLQLLEYAGRKGFSVRPIKSDAWLHAAMRRGIKPATSVLDAPEGREPTEATDAAHKAVEIVWDWVQTDKPMPQVKCFREIMKAECETLGFAKEDIVYIREDIASDVNDFLLKVALEEVVHYVTGATDRSRDFQNYLIDMVVDAYKRDPQPVPQKAR